MVIISNVVSVNIWRMVWITLIWVGCEYLFFLNLQMEQSPIHCKALVAKPFLWKSHVCSASFWLNTGFQLAAWEIAFSASFGIYKTLSRDPHSWQNLTNLISATVVFVLAQGLPQLLISSLSLLVVTCQLILLHINSSSSETVLFQLWF